MLTKNKMVKSGVRRLVLIDSREIICIGDKVGNDKIAFFVEWILEDLQGRQESSIFAMGAATREINGRKVRHHLLTIPIKNILYYDLENSGHFEDEIDTESALSF